MSNSTCEKLFTLIVVRHGQGLHNLGKYDRSELEFTDDVELQTLNSVLTEKGLMQAELVANRLKNTAFDFAISSDLKRAIQTGEAIVKANDTIDSLEQWRIVRERCLGEFEAQHNVHIALRTVEAAVNDRNYLTWRPPKGESVVDVRHRITEFLQQLQQLVMKLPAKTPTILVASHGLFMDELYYVLSEMPSAPSIPKKKPGYQNTGIAQYTFVTKEYRNGDHILLNSKCDISSCAVHLEGHDSSYVGCNGGCHGTVPEKVQKAIDEQPR